jgi:hypothetical protein
LVVGATATVLIKMPLTHPAHAVQASVFALGVLGAGSTDSRVHAGIAGSLLFLAVLAGFVLASRPGALAH